MTQDDFVVDVGIITKFFQRFHSYSVNGKMLVNFKHYCVDIHTQMIHREMNRIIAYMCWTADSVDDPTKICLQMSKNILSIFPENTPKVGVRVISTESNAFFA